MREKNALTDLRRTHTHILLSLFIFSQTLIFFFYAMHISHEYLHPVVRPHSLTAILFCICNILLTINICTRENVNQDTVIQLLW